MGLFDNKSKNCDICGMEISKKHKASDGMICNNCFLSAGYTRGMVIFGTSINTLKLQIANMQTRKNKMEASKVAIDNFVETRILGGVIHIDDNNRTWYAEETAALLIPRIYSMDGITSVWSVSDYSENVISNSEKSGGIGRAIVGGAIAGPVGAVVGAVTRKEKTTSELVTHHIGVVNWIQLDESGVERSHSIDLGIGEKAIAAEHALKTFIE